MNQPLCVDPEHAKFFLEGAELLRTTAGRFEFMTTFINMMEKHIQRPREGTFAWAMQKVVDYQAVRRKGTGDFIIRDKERVLNQTTDVYYSQTIEDLTATDWEVVDEPST